MMKNGRKFKIIVSDDFALGNTSTMTRKKEFCTSNMMMGQKSDSKMGFLIVRMVLLISILIIYPANGSYHYFLNGKEHREDGPAIIYPRSFKSPNEYWISGVRIYPSPTQKMKMWMKMWLERLK